MMKLLLGAMVLANLGLNQNANATFNCGTMSCDSQSICNQSTNPWSCTKLIAVSNDPSSDLSKLEANADNLDPNYLEAYAFLLSGKGYESLTHESKRIIADFGFQKAQLQYAAKKQNIVKEAQTSKQVDVSEDPNQPTVHYPKKRRCKECF
jgi:hypothetical protein